MSTERQKQIWIALVGVRTLPSSELLREATGVYVNVLTWASDEAEFRNKAAELMDFLSFPRCNREPGTFERQRKCRQQGGEHFGARGYGARKPGRDNLTGRSTRGPKSTCSEVVSTTGPTGSSRT
jgi:hypothetical protein